MKGAGKADNQLSTEIDLEARVIHRAKHSASPVEVAIRFSGDDIDRINWLVQDSGWLAADSLQEMLDPRNPLMLDQLNLLGNSRNPGLPEMSDSIISWLNCPLPIVSARPRHDVLVLLSTPIEPSELSKAVAAAAAEAEADLAVKLLEFSKAARPSLAALPLPLEPAVRWILENTNALSPAAQPQTRSAAAALLDIREEMNERIFGALRTLRIRAEDSHYSSGDSVDIALLNTVRDCSQERIRLTVRVEAANILEAALQLKRRLDGCSSAAAAADLLWDITTNIAETDCNQIPRGSRSSKSATDAGALSSPADYLFRHVLNAMLPSHLSVSGLEPQEKSH